MNKIKIAPWKPLLEKAIFTENASNINSATATIATVDSENKPRARVVVCRGFLGNSELKLNEENTLSSNLLAVSTHLSSPKVFQLSSNNVAELVFWFPKSSEEFRLNCKVSILPFESLSTNEAQNFDIKEFVFLKQEYEQFNKANTNIDEFSKETLLNSAFFAHSTGLHRWFSGPAPGSLLDSNAQDIAQLTDNELFEHSKKNFCLLILNPTTVDYVNLASRTHKRSIYSLDTSSNSWVQTNVVP
ncbi:hypothetical protein BB561_001098 [Smittium simulii]|uniref:Pyridoxamine 5'-phosphate oxidase Alr4036 family FMN-binding domain-containing protein n=1 Tax=Smittium simulii TaxID=133385 RepID=A0A2T9YW93_9FUNG|nr:hypothetical protein BB561_001098 [Smittium simulii]